MKKIFICLLAVLLLASCFMLHGCSKDGNVTVLGEALSASDLSIKDFKWETVPSKHNGMDCYTFSLINNSKYDILSVGFTYKVRKDITDDSLAVYSDFMDKHDSYIEETDSPRDVILKGAKNTLVAKGEQMTGLIFTVGFKEWYWYDYPTSEQFALMEPKEMELGILKNNTLYIAYYDFEEKLWLLDDNIVSVDTWSNKKPAKKISKPSETHHVVITDNDDEFEFYSYGITSDEYEQYIESVKNAGFETEEEYSSSFEGATEDGYTINLWYYKDDERLSVSIEKDS